LCFSPRRPGPWFSYLCLLHNKDYRCVPTLTVFFCWDGGPQGGLKKLCN
jgi:hypothetical protein